MAAQQKLKKKYARTRLAADSARIESVSAEPSTQDRVSAEPTRAPYISAIACFSSLVPNSPALIDGAPL